MKQGLYLLIMISTMTGWAQQSSPAFSLPSPLALYSPEWNNVKYAICNTAKDAAYMTGQEQEVIYILNLARYNPTLFANTVLKKYPQESGNPALADNEYYFKSLMKRMLSLPSLQMLYPDQSCFKSALCHATYMGRTGAIGHERETAACKKILHFYGECCDYGNDDPLDIVLSLLIDEGVPSLGHRDICLGYYKQIGVSIQPHKKYGTNTVMDFYY